MYMPIYILVHAYADLYVHVDAPAYLCMRGRLRADTSLTRAEIVSKHDTLDMDMDAMIDMVFDMETQDPDDFLCLLFLASHPRVRLKAVTLVPGSQEQVGLVRWALERLGC